MDQHKVVSYIKSGIRIIGLSCILVGGVAPGVFLLLAGEVIGIIEEMVI